MLHVYLLTKWLKCWCRAHLTSADELGLLLGFDIELYSARETLIQGRRGLEISVLVFICWSLLSYLLHIEGRGDYMHSGTQMWWLLLDLQSFFWPCWIRVTKQNRAAGVLENYAEGEKYSEHFLRKYVRNKTPEIMPKINGFFTDPQWR